MAKQESNQPPASGPDEKKPAEPQQAPPENTKIGPLDPPPPEDGGGTAAQDS